MLSADVGRIRLRPIPWWNLSWLAEARQVVGEFVEHYNNVRLHSAIGYVTPAAKLAGHEKEIWAERDRRLESARELRAQRRQEARAAA